MKDILKQITPVTKDGNLNVIIEIQKGSKNKYELDKETGLIKLDRVMYTGQDYPFDYGFVPNTLCEDGDALDVVLYTTYPLMPGVLLEARPIAVMKMTDSGESDDKIIAVPVEDMRLEKIVSLATAPEHFLKEVKHFMESYKILKNKVVTINATLDENEARKVIAESIELFNK
jgi:inorganic pyrophosphatase